MHNYTEKKVWWVFGRRIRGFRIHLLHGAFGWELQFGTHVFQWFYRGTYERVVNGHAYRHWIDEYGKDHFHKRTNWSWK